MIVVAGSGQYTTFAARMILLPVTLADGAKDAWPLIVVNPSLECVQLEHAGDGRWQVSPDRSLVQARLARSGPGLPLCIPADGLIARLTGSTVAVVLQMPPFAERQRRADRDDRRSRRARQHRGDRDGLHQLKPVITHGAETMNTIFAERAEPKSA